MNEDSRQHELNFKKSKAPKDGIEGAILGAAIGDALGWPQERHGMRLDRPSQYKTRKTQIPFQAWCRRAGGRYYGHEEKIGEGEYSDDTQLLLATARSLQYGHKWLRVFCSQELPIWLLYERGGGGATKRAAKKWLQGIPPWQEEGNQQGNSVQRYFDAGGNGVAMRILPHVLLPGQTTEMICQRVMLNGITTHGHPRALLGALVYAKAVWFAFKTEVPLKFGSLIEHLVESKDEWAEIPKWKLNYEEWWDVANKYTDGGYIKGWTAVVDELLTGLQICQDAMHKGALDVDSDVLEQIGCFDKRINGAGTVATLATVYLASRYAADPVPGMLESAFADGADTDTIASMLGGLFGSFHGTEWIPSEWGIVQDKEYLHHIADVIAGLSVTADVDNESHVEPWTGKMTDDVLNSLVNNQTNEFVLGLLGNAKVVGDIIEHKPLAKSTLAKSWKLVTENGQTIYIKKLSRKQEITRKAGMPTKTNKAAFDVNIIPITVSFLKNLSNCFPSQLNAKMAFDIIAEIIPFLEQERIKHGDKSMEVRTRNETYPPVLIDQIPILKESGIESKAILEIIKIVWNYLANIPAQQL